MGVECALNSNVECLPLNIGRSLLHVFCAEWKKSGTHEIYVFMHNINFRIIRGEPEQAPNTRETGSGVYIYIYIYLCMILHGNDLMCMLKHHVYYVTGKGCQYRRLSKLAS